MKAELKLLMVALLLRQRRLSKMSKSESRREWKGQSDEIGPGELLTSGTLSGWMRSESEALEYLRECRNR